VSLRVGVVPSEYFVWPTLPSPRYVDSVRRASVVPDPEYVLRTVTRPTPS
jgi:hypothetical protein